MVHLYEIDPDGDLLMQLFRKPRDSPDATTDLIPGISDDKQTRPNTPVQLSLVEVAEDKSESGVETNLVNDVSELQVADEPEEVHFLVSSRHLILASRVFKSMLDKNKFREGLTLHAEGSITIPFPDDDPDAFIIVLNIVHGFTRAVNRTIDLTMLTQIAILVDKYQFHETVEVFADIWFSNLTNKMEAPKDYKDPPEVMRWLTLSWIFAKAPTFEAMTRIVQKECKDRLDDEIEHRLPIPERIISAIKQARSDAIEEAIAFIN